MSGFIASDGSSIAGALNPSNNGQALQVDASGNLKVTTGTGVSTATPTIIEDQIRAWTLNGQSFSATTSKQTAAGAINAGVSLFNPAASGKTLVVHACKLMVGNVSFNIMTLTTSDPAYGTALTVTNNRAGSATASIASSTFTNTNVSTVGTANDIIGANTNVPAQIFFNGDVLVVPPGNGVALFLNVSGANNWCVSIEWSEI